MSLRRLLNKHERVLRYYRLEASRDMKKYRCASKARQCLAGAWSRRREAHQSKWKLGRSYSQTRRSRRVGSQLAGTSAWPPPPTSGSLKKPPSLRGTLEILLEFWIPLNGRRTEQAKANLDPRVGPRVAPRVGPRVDPRDRPRERPRGSISLFSAPRKLPRNVPRRRPRKCPRKCPIKWSRFTCPVFTCSVRRPLNFTQRRKNPPDKNRPKIKKFIWTSLFFLNNFCWVPDSCHRECSESSCELFEKRACKRGVEFEIFARLWLKFTWVFDRQSRTPTPHPPKFTKFGLPFPLLLGKELGEKAPKPPKTSKSTLGNYRDNGFTKFRRRVGVQIWRFILHHPAPVRNFCLTKEKGPQRKDFSGRYGFPGFWRVWGSTTTGLESFSWGQKSYPNDFLSVWW